MVPMAVDWKIARRQGQCTGCEHAFVDSETIFSVLRFRDDELQRGDLCSDCFEARDPAEDLIFWRTAHSEKREGLRVDFDLVLAALPKLAADDRGERRDLAFLMALLLVRHRRLRLKGVSRRKGKEFMVLRKVRSQDSFEIEARDLDPERRARLTAELGELMDPTREGGFEDLVEASAE